MMNDLSKASPIPSRTPTPTPLVLERADTLMAATPQADPLRLTRNSLLLYIQGRISDALDGIIRGLHPSDEQPPPCQEGLMSALEQEKAEVYACESGLAASVSDAFAEAVDKAHRQQERKTRSSAHAILLVMKSIGAYTYEHCTRLVDLALDLAKEMGYEDDQLYREVEYGVTYKDIGEAAYFLTRQDDKQRQALAAFLAGLNLAQDALLHDIGKLAIPEDILNKPAPLTAHEMNVMRMHPVWGYEILVGLGDMQHALPVVRHHHERWDGTGYPDRLLGEQIPLAARIVAVVDAFDAMTVDRPYRKAMTLAQAREEILDGAGSQFDPQVAATFAHMLEPHVHTKV